MIYTGLGLQLKIINYYKTSRPENELRVRDSRIANHFYETTNQFSWFISKSRIDIYINCEYKRFSSIALTQ